MPSAWSGDIVVDFAVYTFGAFAAAASGWALYSHGLFDGNLASASAAFLFLLVMHVRNAVGRTSLARHVAEDMDDLRADNQAIRSALDDAKKSMTAQALELVRRNDAQQKMLMAELQAIERAMKAHAAHTVTAQAVHAAQGFRQRPPPAPHDAMARARRASSQPPAAATAARRLDVPTPGWSGDIAEPAMLPIIRKALEGNRIDVYLQPVVTLPQRKVRFYEALTRLRSEDGTVIMPAQFMKVAGPAGLMSVVDNLLLFRCVQMLRRLSARQRDVAVFCNISGPTLHDREFFPQFLEFLSGNKDLANNIVFEFGQAAVMAANAAEAANLRHLANLGFRLSLDGVTQLNLDFARVRRLGFQFLKLKASTLLFGMAEAKADVAAEDFKALLFRNGIDLIVERIESEKTVVQLLDYDIEFGQGYLFGEPRPLRDLGEAGQSPLAAIPANVALLSRGLKRRLAG